MKIWEEPLNELVEAMQGQLKSDDARWGETWITRTRKGQEERTILTFMNYFDQYQKAGVPIPWLKIVGNALICWYRDQHPEMWKE